MEHGDIDRITRELEDLLMNNEDKLAAGGQMSGKEKLERSKVPECDADSGRMATERMATERMATERMATERMATERMATERMAAEQMTVEQVKAEQAAVERMAVEQETAAAKEPEEILVPEEELEEEPEEEPEEDDVRRPVRKRKRGYRGISGRLIRPYDGLVAAFAVPIVIMLIIFAQRGIFPFGEESFLRTDMYHQYAPFFSEFRDKLTNGGSLLYSWNVGMGINFSALYAYYLASPLNWLLIFCPKGLVIEFMTYMIVLKTGLCGLAMAWYLRRHCKTCDFGIAFFGIFYALSGYMAAYSWNIMWLDCIILFPVIMLGLERLVQEGRGLLYCVALGLSILSNYYISIMTCIFMVIYFIVLLILEKNMSWEKFIGRSFQFAVYSLLAGGLAAVVLLPEIYALQMTASGDFNFPKTFTQYFPIFDMIARHIGNVETEIGLDHWPNIYCGVAVLMFFVLYLAERRISGKEKAVYCLMLLLFFASFSFNVLNFIWHGFHFPNSLPCRQSYIYIFLVLCMCYRAYMYLEEMPRCRILSAFWCSVGFVILAQKLVTAEHFHFIVYYVAILFLALYLGVIFLYQKGRRFRNRALLLALVVVSIEAAVNTTVTSVTTTSRTAYIKDNAAVERLVDTVSPNTTFFRMEKVDQKTKNDGAWMHFPSVSLFSSTANADLSKLFKKLGCESSTNAYSITGATPLIDALFSVRYGLYSEENESSGLRRLLAQEEDTYLYENLYTLPLGFWVSSDFEARWNLDLGHPADVQNALADAADAFPVLTMVMDTDSEGQSQSFFPTESGEYYAYVGNRNIEKVSVTTARGKETFNNVDRGYLIDLGYCAAGQQVTLTAEDSKETMWADIYRFSEAGLSEVCQKLSSQPWTMTSWTDDTLAGTITCGSAGILFTSIPFDEGWTIRVDGQKTTAMKLLDAFIGVNLTAGSHIVEMEYHPKGLETGALITIVSLLLLLVMVWIERKLLRHWEDLETEEEFSEGEFYDDEFRDNKFRDNEFCDNEFIDNEFCDDGKSD